MAEESPIPDPDVVPDDSEAELEAIDGKDVDPEVAKAATEEMRRGCEVDPGSSTGSEAPIKALLLLLGVVASRRIWLIHRARESRGASGSAPSAFGP